MKIHLLDVGRTKFGDCILIQHGDRSILIDGAHPGDAELIHRQLKKLLRQGDALHVDLLIVTHCHSDHIGCLPTLVEADELSADFALVADEGLGFTGSTDDGRDAVDALGLSRSERGLVVALQEEDHSDLPPAELNQFLQDAATLEDKYIAMLATLKDQGTKVVRYGTDAESKVRAIEQEFASFGLKVLGPTVEHLKKCAQTIGQDSVEIAQAITQDAARISDAGPSALVDAYKRLVKRVPSPTASADPEFAQDRPGPGAARNDQSIVITVEADGWKALLAGDMQFAKAEVSGLTPMMKALRARVKAAGAYDFVKFTHHTSYNGVDDSVMAEYESTELFVHTGGLNDPTHPDPDALHMIKGLRRSLTFARTDHNGLITVAKSNGKLEMSISKGRFNDFTPNSRPDEGMVERSPQRESGAPRTPPVEVLEFGGSGNGEDVQILTRVPHTDTRVTVTVDVSPGKKKVVSHRTDTGEGGRSQSSVRLALGGGRPMPKLVFVTSSERLAANIGHEESQSVLAAIKAANGVQLVDLPPGIDRAEAAAELVRPHLVNGVEGVVLIGGYDVVPSNRLDVLDASLRQAVDNAGSGGQDADDFVVWSDEIYGDIEGDAMPELPVSRIPDGRRADVVMSALAAPSIPTSGRFGVRNLNRPFAVEVFPLVPGPSSASFEKSEMLSPQDVPDGAAAGAVYFMLHGSARDGTRFWGETRGGDLVEAIAVENVPAMAPGTVVFSGCCWGALPMSPAAVRVSPGTPLRPRSPESSLAIAYLKAGALGFVGCTGSHYSPLAKPFNFYGKPLHDAFWKSLAGNTPPAPALFKAKQEFARSMPHGRTDPFSQAIEVKILRQFTCLGLGW